MSCYYPFIRGSGWKQKKKPAKKKSNYFEELNATQCKQLAMAAKLKASDSKRAIVNRLMEHEFVGQFGGNKKKQPFGGSPGNVISAETLKGKCRERRLPVGGTKFDLLLRVVQHQHGTGGDSLKRKASSKSAGGVDDESTTNRHVAKKQKVAAAAAPKKPSPKDIYNRIQKKLRACSSQKKYQSYLGSKYHALEVSELVSELFYSLKDYTSTDPKLVLDGCCAVVSSFTNNLAFIRRPGHCEDSDFAADQVVKYANLIRSSVSQKDLDKLANAMMNWKRNACSYSLLNRFDMEKATRTIRRVPPLESKDIPQEEQQDVNKEVVEPTGKVCAPPLTRPRQSHQLVSKPPRLHEGERILELVLPSRSYALGCCPLQLFFFTSKPVALLKHINLLSVPKHARPSSLPTAVFCWNHFFLGSAFPSRSASLNGTGRHVKNNRRL